MRKPFLVLILLSLLLSSCHVGRFFYWNFADVKDYKRFQSLPVDNGGVPFTFKSKTSQQLFLPDTVYSGSKGLLFNEALEKTKTLAFLVIRNDTILFEELLSW